MSGDLPDLGTCCVCGTRRDVTNVVTLDRRGPTPGKGWGCFVCGLPFDGAFAVLCSTCLGQTPVFVCVGYPAGNGARALLADLDPEPFAHDEVAHRIDEAVA
jgi:hypothetical protein